MIGMNNIELITDRPLADNLREIAECKAAYPDRAIVASLMTDCNQKAWHDLINAVQTVPVDGFELNFGCPHGMSERGMGSAVGQDPELVEQITRWTKEAATVPVIVKLTPNITDVRYTARAAARGGADAISLINTINSLMGVDLDTWNPIPDVDGKSSHGGFCGPAVKPIALNMVGECARDPGVTVPISGIGGIATWRDAVEFMLMGSDNVQVCTAVMHDGFRIVGDMIEGLNNYLDDRGIASVSEIVGKTVPRFVNWNDLNLDYKIVAQHRSGNVHQLQPLLDRVRGRGAPMHRPAGRRTRRNHRSRSTRNTASAAICAAWSVRSMSASTMVRVDSGESVHTWRERLSVPS